jgi:hypothetical protein
VAGKRTAGRRTHIARLVVGEAALLRGLSELAGFRSRSARTRSSLVEASLPAANVCCSPPIANRFIGEHEAADQEHIGRSRKLSL